MPQEKGPLRIPKRIRLPFGYTIKVELRTMKQMEAELEAPVYGFWVVETRTIYIGKDLPVKKRRSALLHELRHALADYEHYCTEVGISKP